MAANIAPIFPIAPVSAIAQFLNADGTVAKSIYTPTLTNGVRVDGILITNTDTISYLFQLLLRKGATSYLLGTATIPASAGNLGSAQPVNLLAAIAAASGGPNPFPVDSSGNMILYLDAASSLWGGVTVAITAGKQINALTIAGEY